MVTVFGLLLYIVIPTVGGGKDQSVFSASFWYSYGCSLFCEYQCIVHLLCIVTSVAPIIGSVIGITLYR